MPTLSHFGLTFAVVLIFTGLSSARLYAAQSSENTTVSLNWQSQARLRHSLTKSRGTLSIGADGVVFRPEKGSRLHWPFAEIQSFHVTPHRLLLKTYKNRRWHFPGDRQFRFDVESAMPPEVAAEFARRVERPVINGNPPSETSGFATVPARHRTRLGGTNGLLRFRDGGIDYVTPTGQGARRWRWADIWTLANPDPYHFRIAGYLEIFEFELKQPMSRELFDRLWDYVYARGLDGLTPDHGPMRGDKGPGVPPGPGSPR